MTVPTHLNLGAKIYEAVSLAVPLTIDRRWFLYGNIYPDLSHYVFSAPHFAELSMGFVKHRIRELSEYQIGSNELDPIFSLQLGVLCHYISDFFCHVHSTAYKGTMTRHLAYEIHQQTLMMRHPRLIGRKTTASLAPLAPLPTDAQSACEALEDAQAAYLAAPHRPDMDLLFAVKMSSLITASVLSICMESARGSTLVPGIALA